MIGRQEKLDTIAFELNGHRKKEKEMAMKDHFHEFMSQLEITDENIFISATCGEQGLTFLEGKGELSVRYTKDMENAKVDTNGSENKSVSKNTYKTTLSFDGNVYEVTIDSK